MDNEADKLEAAFGHFGHLSPDELKAKVRQIRQDRRISKVKAGAKKAAKAKSDGAKVSAKKMLDKLGDADLVEKLLKELEGG